MVISNYENYVMKYLILLIVKCDSPRYYPPLQRTSNKQIKKEYEDEQVL